MCVRSRFQAFPLCTCVGKKKKKQRRDARVCPAHFPTINKIPYVCLCSRVHMYVWQSLTKSSGYTLGVYSQVWCVCSTSCLAQVFPSFQKSMCIARKAWNLGIGLEPHHSVGVECELVKCGSSLASFLGLPIPKKFLSPLCPGIII